MKNSSSKFYARDERFPEPVDLSELPANRGFWTDEEMSHATGVNSLLLVKNLQRRGMLTASKYKTDGKWHRAWTFQDLLAISLTADLAKHAGVGILTAIEMLSLIPEELQNRAFSREFLIDQAVDIFTAYVSPHGAVGEAEDRSWKLRQIDEFDLVMIDRSELFARIKGSKQEGRRIGYLEKDMWRAPDAANQMNERCLDDALDKAGSVLELHLSRLGLGPFSTQFQLPIEIEFIQPE